jgi:MFS family permease
VAVSELWAVEMLLAAFAGGVLGASIGALPSFSLAGLMVVVGELYRIVGRTTGAGTLPVDITNGIGFGVVLGPHVAFGGGAAAVAYAASRGYRDPDAFDYHPAKEVTCGLGSRPDVLAVGGAFGVLGYWIATLSGTLAVPVDPVALGVVGSALAHRVAFGYSVIGAAPGRLLDMSPFEDGRREDAVADGGRALETGRLVVEPWLPYQYRWGGVSLLGVAFGVLGAYVAYLTGSAFLAFGVSVVALVFVNAGVDGVPVTHHMTLPASTVVLALATGPNEPAAIAASLALGPALVAGALAGLGGALAGELLQRVLYAHADTHLDPPAASIVVTSLAIALLAMAGVLPGAVWIPTP